MPNAKEGIALSEVYDSVVRTLDGYKPVEE